MSMQEQGPTDHCRTNVSWGAAGAAVVVVAVVVVAVVVAAVVVGCGWETNTFWKRSTASQMLLMKQSRGVAGRVAQQVSMEWSPVFKEVAERELPPLLVSPQAQVLQDFIDLSYQTSNPWCTNPKDEGGMCGTMSPQCTTLQFSATPMKQVEKSALPTRGSPKVRTVWMLPKISLRSVAEMVAMAPPKLWPVMQMGALRWMALRVWSWASTVVLASPQAVLKPLCTLQPEHLEQATMFVLRLMIQFWMLLEPRKATTMPLREEENPVNPCRSPTELLKVLTPVRGYLLHLGQDQALMVATDSQAMLDMQAMSSASLGEQAASIEIERASKTKREERDLMNNKPTYSNKTGRFQHVAAPQPSSRMQGNTPKPCTPGRLHQPQLFYCMEGRLGHLFEPGCRDKNRAETIKLQPRPLPAIPLQWQPPTKLTTPHRHGYQVY